MVEQRTANVRTVGWSLRQKELPGIVLDAIQSLRPRARASPVFVFVDSLNSAIASTDLEKIWLGQ